MISWVFINVPPAHRKISSRIRLFFDFFFMQKCLSIFRVPSGGDV